MPEQNQPVNTLPIKTASGMAATDYLLGIGSTEEYQMLIQDLGDYIIQNVLSSLAGQSQTLADAFTTMNNVLTMVAKYDGAATFSSKETLSTVLDGLLNAQTAYKIGYYKLTCTAAFDSFSRGYDYCAQLTRAGSLDYCIAELTPIDDGLVKILGKRKSTGWSFELAPSRTEINTLNNDTVNTIFASADTSKYTLNKVRLIRRGNIFALLGEVKCVSPATSEAVGIVSSGMPNIVGSQVFVPAWGVNNASKDALGVMFTNQGIFLTYGTAGGYYELCIPMVY